MTKSAEEVAKEVSQMLNTMGDSATIKSFVIAMDHEHRTLQQGFTRLVVAWIKNLAEKKENWYDARNEASVRLAKKIVEVVGEDDLHLPLI